MVKNFDFCILGAGLAGVSLAHELSKEDVSVCLIDPNGVASGASGTPLGLVNPATGRYATLTWEAEKCYEAIYRNLALIQEQSPVPFFKKSGVLRPALDDKIATRMKENFDSMLWPKGWIEWLDEQELKNFHPGISCTVGGVWLPIGLTVDVSTYLNEFVKFLSVQGVSTFLGINYSFSKKNTVWEIELSGGEKINAAKLIFTTGVSVRKSDFWKDFPIYPVKGQLAVMESASSLSFDHSVSALGYIASLNKNQFVIGSTYEHKFVHEETDEQGLNYLVTRFGKVLPELKESSKVISQWSGVRASTPNRMPIIGNHQENENLSVFAGLGSKGLLYSAYLSKRFSGYLLNKESLPPEVDLNRIA